MIKKPVIDPSAFIAEGARVVGDVTIGKDVSVWFNAVIRGDSSSVEIGDRTNIQDGCILHEHTVNKLIIGNDVNIGHGAILHGCEIGDNVLIGMGSILMNGVKIGKNSIVGAGALVTEYKEFPEGSLIIGSPAKLKRPLTQEEIDSISENVEAYVRFAKEYAAMDEKDYMA